jgi:hypothetical protein
VSAIQPQRRAAFITKNTEAFRTVYLTVLSFSISKHSVVVELQGNHGVETTIFIPMIGPRTIIFTRECQDFHPVGENIDAAITRRRIDTR